MSCELLACAQVDSVSLIKLLAPVSYAHAEREIYKRANGGRERERDKDVRSLIQKTRRTNITVTFLL